MEQKRRYMEFLANKENKEETLKENFFAEQTKNAKELVTQNFQFGEQLLIKEVCRYESTVIFKVDLSKFEEQYDIEYIEYESGWKRYHIEKHNYVETYVLTPKCENVDSLPICIQVVFYPKWLEVYNDKYTFSKLGISYPEKVEVYTYVMDKKDILFSYFKKMPVIQRVSKNIDFNDEIITGYIDSKKIKDVIAAHLADKTVIDGFSSIKYLKEDISSEESPKITLENLLERIIKERILEDYNFYSSLNTYKIHNNTYTLLDNKVEVNILIERKSFVSDIEIDSSYHDIFGTIKNKEFEVILVTATVKIDGTDFEKDFKYSDINFDYTTNVKELLTEILL